MWWVELSKSELLDVRLCDLELEIESSWLTRPIDVARQDLARKGLEAVKPHFWLSDEWFTPAGVTGVAIPFYLAHPRLMRLERSEMLAVEGGSQRECVKLLRHELGHVVDHAFRLSRKKRWRELFGRTSKPYPEYYRPNPASRAFVQFLDHWYAQAHPDEDFAETFAVWLTPNSGWRKRYAQWPALEKLEYVDELMKSIAGRKPVHRSRKRVDSLRNLKHTIRDYYEAKKEHYAVSYPDIYDRDLLKIFSEKTARNGDSETAAAFLRRHRVSIRRQVAEWTGESEFTLEQVFDEMIGRCRELKLRAVGAERKLRLNFAILLTVKTMHHLYAERHWLPV